MSSLQKVTEHFNPRLFNPQTFSTMNFLTPWFKNSWLKSPGLKSSWLKGQGLKLGVEKSGVMMSFSQNCRKKSFGINKSAHPCTAPRTQLTAISFYRALHNLLSFTLRTGYLDWGFKFMFNVDGLSICLEKKSFMLEELSLEKGLFCHSKV